MIGNLEKGYHLLYVGRLDRDIEINVETVSGCGLNSSFAVASCCEHGIEHWAFIKCEF